MKVHSATLAGGDNNQDRLFVTDNAVIVLDGASAFEPVDVDAGLYAETLGAVIAEQLAQHQAVPIAAAVATGIRQAAQRFALTPGRSPSSTVSVLRVRPQAVDLYVLGNIPIHYKLGPTEHVLADNRIDQVGGAEREHYLAQLRGGLGFGPEHRNALAELQRAQRAARNRPGGYWIAETTPEAAGHGINLTVPLDAVNWAVIATDGAADPIDQIYHHWGPIRDRALADSRALIRELFEWEKTADPDGRALPRAKRHDDKTLALIDFDQTPDRRST